MDVFLQNVLAQYVLVESVFIFMHKIVHVETLRDRHDLCRFFAL